MIRLSIPMRQALAKLTLPVLIAAAFVLMLLGKADTFIAERARMALADALAPIYGLLAEPVARLRDLADSTGQVFSLASENTRLREENEQLRRWQAIALALDAENTALKADLRWIPDPTPSFVTARVVADAGGVYARAVLLSAGPDHGITKGQIALDDRGLVGRVTEVGARSVRVLLLTDMNSRIPVILEGSRGRSHTRLENAEQPRHPDRHQRGAAAAGLLDGRRAAGRRRAGGDQRRGQRLSRRAAGGRSPFQQPEGAGSGDGGAARPVGDRAPVRLRHARPAGARDLGAAPRRAAALICRGR